MVSWLKTNSQRPQTLLTAPRKKPIKNWPAFKSLFNKTKLRGHSSIHCFTQTAVFIPSISPVAAITVNDQFSALPGAILTTVPRAELPTISQQPCAQSYSSSPRVLGNFPFPSKLPLSLHFPWTGQTPFLAFVTALSWSRTDKPSLLLRLPPSLRSWP